MKICPTCLGRYDEQEQFCREDGAELRHIHTDGEDKMLGRVLDGRWLIDEKIGEGGMGAVYRGEQTSVGRVVAVKTLRGGLADTDEYIERFFREANVASTLNDPHCVTIYDFGQDPEDHALYLAMEYLDGRALREVLEQDHLTLREALTVGVQICSALAAAHQRSIVHRDLKPDNIFLVDVPGDKIFVKVLDFGIAKILDAETATVTRTGQIFGTPAYMSPEQCRSAAVDERSDLYAVGIILYELVSGRLPFGGSTPLRTLIAHVSSEAKPPSKLGIEVPDEVEAIIMRLLEKDPAHRFQAALDVREALEEQLEELSADALGVTPALARGDMATAETDTSKPRTVLFDDLAADGGEPVDVVDLGEAGRAATGDFDEEGEEREEPAGDGEAPAAAEKSSRGSDGGRVWLAVGAAVLVAAGAWLSVDGFERDAPEPPEPTESGAPVAAAVDADPVEESDREQAALVLAAGEVAGERIGRAYMAAAAAQQKSAAQAAEEKRKKERIARRKETAKRASKDGPDGRPDPKQAGQKSADKSALDAVPSVLTERVAQRIISSRESQITACFEKGLLRDSDFGGRVVVKMVVAAHGEVANAKIIESSIDAADVESCIVERIEAWTFPQTVDGRVKILKTPFSFQAP